MQVKILLKPSAAVEDLFAHDCETALQPRRAGGYVSIPWIPPTPAPPEDDGERARALPYGEYVPGFSGRNLARQRPADPAERRQPRGEAASSKAHRRQGRRRALAHPGRCPEGPYSLGSERRRGARAASAVLGELGRWTTTAVFLPAPFRPHHPGAH